MTKPNELKACAKRAFGQSLYGNGYLLTQAEETAIEAAVDAIQSRTVPMQGNEKKDA